MRFGLILFIGSFFWLTLMRSPIKATPDENIKSSNLRVHAVQTLQETLNVLDPSVSFIGKKNSERIGYYLSSAGDVNGDGLDDFMVAVYHHYKHGWNCGGVYLFLGRRNVTWGLGESIDEADALFCGKNKYDLVGYNVAGKGDFNGDGYDDMLIGAPGNWESDPPVPGTLFIVLGKKNIDYGKDFILADYADLSYIGEKECDQLGYAVDFIGDINHDGCDDVLCAAPYKTINSDKWTGKAYLILGKGNNFARGVPVMKEAVATFIYPHYEGILGASLSDVGDMNQDGTSDFALSAYGAGTIFLFWGKTNFDWGYDFDCHNADHIFKPEGIRGNAGWQLKGVGDVNGDRIPDFAVSGITLEWSSGKIYLILGRHHWESKEISLGQADASFKGESQNEAGVSINGVGDFDGDGFDDFVIGARYHSRENFYHAGKVYLIRGSATNWQRNVELRTIPDRFLGTDEISCLGWGTAGIGDFNGDSRSDFIVSAPFYNGGGNRRGQIFLFLGSYRLTAILGRTFYYGHQEAVSDVQMDLTGDVTMSQTTEEDGKYQFYLERQHNYRVTPSKSKQSDLNEDCITVYDASLAAQHAINLKTLHPLQQIAADVNRDGSITLYDAALIMRHALNLPDRKDSYVGTWAFSPESRYYENLVEQRRYEDFICIVIGDIDASWQAPGSAMRKQPDAAGVYVPSETRTSVGEIIKLPITIDEHQNMLAFEIKLEYNSDFFEFIEFEKGLLLNEFKIETNSKRNILRIGGFGMKPIQASGTLLSLNFKVIHPDFASSYFVWTNLRLNNLESRSALTRFNSGDSAAQTRPNAIDLLQNYPNPFNPETVIQFHLQKTECVHISIYNIMGQQIRNLIDGIMNAGYHEITWNGNNKTGNAVADGVYFIKASFGNDMNNIRIIKILKIK